MTNILDDDSEYEDTAAIAARSTKLCTGPNGVTYYLEPKYGHIRGIVCRRVDGTRIKCPDKLEGGFTDARNAQAAVDGYLNTKGKAQVLPSSPPTPDFRMAAPLAEPVDPKEQENLVARAIAEQERIKQELANEQLVLDDPAAPIDLSGPAPEPVPDDEEELVDDPEVPATINLSAGTPDPEGETVTQRALRERLAAASAPAAEPAPVKPATKKRAPRSKQV